MSNETNRVAGPLAIVTGVTSEALMSILMPNGELETTLGQLGLRE